MVTTHLISAALAGNRLDHVLRRLFPDTPRRVLVAWLAEGCVTLDGRVARKSQLTALDQRLVVTPPRTDVDVAREPLPLTILFESEDVVVVDKPAGQASSKLQGGAAFSVAAQLLDRYPNMHNFGHSAQDAGLIHRLDTGTSGVLVAAKSAKAFDALTTGLRNGELDKTYVAWTTGTLPNERGSIAEPLHSDPRNKRRVVVAIGRNRPSHPVHVTHYEVLAVDNGVTLVRLHAPVATRHQIRAHLASVGCPLLGDPLYGGPPDPRLQRHALHALYVGYRGAAGCSPFDCTSTPPDDVRGLVPFDFAG